MIHAAVNNKDQHADGVAQVEGPFAHCHRAFPTASYFLRRVAVAFARMSANVRIGGRARERGFGASGGTSFSAPSRLTS